MSLILDDLGGNTPVKTEYVRLGTLESFQKDVLELSKEKTVFAYFVSPLNPRCETFKALLEKYIRLAEGKAILVQFNIEEVQQIAMQLGVQSVPATMIFSNGGFVDGFSGELSEAQLKQVMQALIGKAAFSIDEMIKDAQKKLENQEVEEALTAFAGVLEKDEVNPVAFAGMIRCFIQMNQLEAAQDLSDGLEESLKNPELDAARIALKLALEAQSAPNPSEFEEKIKQNPEDLQARFEYALALFAHQEAEKAIDLLISIIEKDREWNNDSARQQLFKIFSGLGNTNPITVAGRRKLSSLLFS